MRRLTILLAALGALLLVPAAQAFAENHLTVKVAGSGSGEVISKTPSDGSFVGAPPIACSSPAPGAGVCESTMGGGEFNEEEEFEESGIRGIDLVANAAPGSEFSGYTIEEGNPFGPFSGCHSSSSPETQCFAYGFEGEDVKVTVTFTCTESCGPSGPTNLRTLTITKSGNGPGGTGSVSSKPKGIKCGTTCTSAVADMYKNTPVVLTEKPGTTSTFVEWTGACSGSEPTCTVPMSEDEEVGAVFTGTSKELNPAEALTVSKGESSGKGTVKGPGLGCEAECTSTVVLFQGPITGEKPKPGKTVVLKQAPAFGSAFVGWSGCESEPEGNCQVAMETAKEVVAEYEALPSKALMVNKSYAKGNGAVSSKPKGIKCGTACTQAVAQMPEGAAVELTAKPSTGTFVKWEGGDCEGSTNPVCVVTMNTDETTKAVFSDPSKALPSEATLTLNKEGSAFGTVKAAGLGCEVLCSSTSVLYQGPITGEKPKPGKTVILKAVSAPGSKKVVWGGCDSETEAGECVVEMDENHAVTATFDELE